MFQTLILLKIQVHLEVLRVFHKMELNLLFIIVLLQIILH